VLDPFRVFGQLFSGFGTRNESRESVRDDAELPENDGLVPPNVFVVN
jgi:hypothetical protein